jgi:hypothetical protein
MIEMNMATGDASAATAAAAAAAAAAGQTAASRKRSHEALGVQAAPVDAFKQRQQTSLNSKKSKA